MRWLPGERKMFLLLFTLLIVGAALILSSCSSYDSGDWLDRKAEDHRVHLEDGTTIRCLYWDHDTGGVSCDWVGYHQRYGAGNG